jgi:acyl-CoA dehydrogenase
VPASNLLGGEGEGFRGTRIIDEGGVQQWIAESRIQIEQVRLLVLKAAWLMDTVGNKGARFEVSAIKVAAADLATTDIDRAIQASGASGLSQDGLLAELYALARTLHFVDGPDEVHKMSIARRESRAYRDRADAAAAGGR